MKKILLLTALASLFFACNEGKNCANPPILDFDIYVVNTPTNNSDLINSFNRLNYDGTATLYKVVNNEKVKYLNCPIVNKNIWIRGISQKDFFTRKLETFYLEYEGKTNTLQIKGIYYDEDCGDIAYLTELHFNDKKIDLKTSSIENNTNYVYKIDNTK